MATPVWLLADALEPRDTTLYTLRLAGRLHEHGFAPTVVCASTAHVASRVRQLLQFREVPALAGGYGRAAAIRRLVAEAADDPPALLHAQRRVVAPLALDLARRLQRPYLVTVHDVLPPGHALPVLPELLAGVVAMSPAVERDLIYEANLPADWVTVIPGGVELPEAPAAPVGPTGRVPIVGMCAALEPRKGALYFLMAAELILASGHDVEFLVAGAGTEEETLRRAARHLDVAQRVTFAPFPTDYAEMLAMLDVFVVPSLDGGLGTVMLEAMALGKPVVATKVDDVADFFADGDTALLAPRANHVALADKVQHLLDNPGRARKLGAAGQRFVRDQFAVDRMVRDTAKLYRAALDAAAAG